MSPRAPLQIDRFRLELPGGSASEGRKLAALVVARLAEAGALPQAGDLPALNVVIPATTGDPVRLAEEISAGILRALAHQT